MSEPQENDGYAHLREIGKLRAKAIKVALKLQAKVYEQRLDDHEKRIAANESTANRLWGALAIVSILVGWYLAWRK